MLKQFLCANERASFIEWCNYTTASSSKGLLCVFIAEIYKREKRVGFCDFDTFSANIATMWKIEYLWEASNFSFMFFSPSFQSDQHSHCFYACEMMREDKKFLRIICQGNLSKKYNGCSWLSSFKKGHFFHSCLLFVITQLNWVQKLKKSFNNKYFFFFSGVISCGHYVCVGVVWIAFSMKCKHVIFSWSAELLVDEKFYWKFKKNISWTLENEFLFLSC